MVRKIGSWEKSREKIFCVNVQGEMKFHFITTVITSYNIVDKKLFPVIIS